MTLGTSALVGLGVMIILVPAQGFIASRLGRLRHALLAKTDQRVRIVNEILQGIRVIKYYAWEGRFAETVEDIRTKEVKILTSQATFRYFLSVISTILCLLCSVPSAIMVFFLVASPVFVSMATFGVFAGLGNVLTPEIIFPALAYFNLLRFPMTFMPMLVICTWLEAALLVFFNSRLYLSCKSSRRMQHRRQAPVGFLAHGGAGKLRSATEDWQGWSENLKRHFLLGPHKADQPSALGRQHERERGPVVHDRRHCRFRQDYFAHVYPRLHSENDRYVRLYAFFFFFLVVPCIHFTFL